MIFQFKSSLLGFEKQKYFDIAKWNNKDKGAIVYIQQPSKYLVINNTKIISENPTVKDYVLEVWSWSQKMCTHRNFPNCTLFVPLSSYICCSCENYLGHSSQQRGL